MTEQEILRALALKHYKDVFVPQCKDGPSYGLNHATGGSFLRIDAWVMPRSWAKPWCTAYEVKVSRSDFLNDDKWPHYLPCCHQFYFACPWGMIQPDELPAEAGVRWVSSKGNRVVTKKKAALRKDVEIPEELFRYILMARARIDAEALSLDEERAADYWRRWEQKKQEKRELGHRVAGAIAQQYAQMESRVHLMEKQVKGYELVRARLQELGFNPEVPIGRWGLQSWEARILGAIPQGFRSTLRRVGIEVGRLEKEIATLEGEEGDDT